MARGWWFVAGGLWLVAGAAARPVLAQAPLAAPHFVRPAPPPAQDSTPTIRFPRTHWVEGARIGAVVMGAWMALGAGSWCSQESESGHCAGAFIAGAVTGAMIGYGVGALIGGLIPKEPASP